MLFPDRQESVLAEVDTGINPYNSLNENCEIKKYTTNVIPDDLPSCKALDWGGIPTINVAYKLEETDMGMDDEYDYHSDLRYTQDAYMRNVITDRNCDIPFADGDTPAYNATRNSGALNLRYNGSRGTTDYRPAHPEMMIGQDPFAGQDVGIKLAELKKFTAQRAGDAEVRMGDNNTESIPEQPWGDPEISYAKKEAMVWSGHLAKSWSWPQFYNINVSHQTELNPMGDKQNVFNCAVDCTNEGINADATYDKLGKVKHQQIGYQYDLGKYQTPTIDFQEGNQNKVMSTKHPERVEDLRNKAKMGSHNLTDHSVKAQHFKGQLYHAMKSAALDQEMSGKMGNSIKGNKVKSGGEYEKKSVIKNIVETRKKNKEVMTNIRTGVHQTRDAGFLKRDTQYHIRGTLQMKANMVKGSRNDKDIGFLKREIQNSMKLNKEEKTKLCATALRNNVDRGQIMRDIQTTHKTGCSEKTKCYTDGGGHYLEDSRKVGDAPSQMFQDDYHTHHKKSKHLEVNPRSIKDYSALTDDVLDTNISDTSRINSRNRW